MYATNAILEAASIAAFDALVPFLFRPGLAASTRSYRLSMLWRRCFVAHAIFSTLDYARTVSSSCFFVSCRAAVLARSAFAVAVIFSKETGAALAPSRRWRRGGVCSRTRTSWPADRHAPLPRSARVAPLAPLAVLDVVAPSRHDPLGWLNSYDSHRYRHEPVETFLNTNLADPGIRSFLTDIFVLNYQWLYTGVVVAALCSAMIRVERPDQEPLGSPRRGMVSDFDSRRARVPRHAISLHQCSRYVLLTSPVLILTFYHALVFLLESRVSRLCYLTLCTCSCSVEFLDARFRVRSIFGTLAFGYMRFWTCRL